MPALKIPPDPDVKTILLFDKKAEEFILPNVKHYPEISNLKKLEYK